MIHQRHRQTARQTDGQTTSDHKTARCTIVHRAVKCFRLKGLECLANDAKNSDIKTKKYIKSSIKRLTKLAQQTEVQVAVVLALSKRKTRKPS